MMMLQEYTNLFFVILFTGEMLMKMYALGFNVSADPTLKKKLVFKSGMMSIKEIISREKVWCFNV